MGPTIILDKSALQALSRTEIRFLFKYYYVVVTPVLLSEILGDLVKRCNKGEMPKREVQQLSSKLLSRDSAVNIYYRHLCLGSLLGQHVAMTGQAVVPATRAPMPTVAEAVPLDERDIRAMLSNWQKGVFSNSDEKLALQWRHTLQTLDLEQYKRQVKEWLRHMPRMSCPEDLVSDVQEFTSNPSPAIQLSCLKGLMDDIDLQQHRRNAICKRWLKEQVPLFKHFAPYAYYCFRANVIFHLGLASGLVSARRTDWIDWEYVYYLPFCMVFSSRDKLHVRFSPFFLRHDQQFVHGDDLKRDLKRVAKQWEGLDPSLRRHHATLPPANPESLTHRLWQQHLETIRVWLRSVGRAHKDTTSNGDL